ncbi:phage portal protein [Diaphorobacter nitroreducens]|nr:phage portal protein [Diaphorobacter nitroreducens]
MKPSLVGRVRAAVGALTGRSASLSDSAGSSHVFGVALGGVHSISHRSMMQLSAAMACVRLISETISTLPLGIYIRSPSGKRLAPEHALHGIVHDVPNDDSTASVFWESMVAAMLTRGAGRARRLMFNGRLVGLQFLDPECLSPRRRIGRRVVEWQYRDDDGSLLILPDSEVWTIPGFSLDGRNGISVIEYGSKVFGNALAADNAAGRTFNNGALQNLYYTIKKWLTPEQREEFHRNVGGLLAQGKAPLLEGEIEAKTVSINPKDVQLLESRSWSVEEICRWFRVPPWMVGHSAQGATKWGSGMEQEMIGFLTFTLGTWLKRIEQAINKDLLTPAERTKYYAKFSVEGLLRADSAARASFYGALVDRGIMTRDEVRELEDLPPMGGNAAQLTVQSAMTLLDAIGANTDAQQVRASLRALLGLDDNEPQKG